MLSSLRYVSLRWIEQARFLVRSRFKIQHTSVNQNRNSGDEPTPVNPLVAPDFRPIEILRSNARRLSKLASQDCHVSSCSAYPPTSTNKTIQRILISVLLALLVQIPGFAAKDDSWENDDAWIAFRSQHKALYDEIYPIAKRMRRDSITIQQARKLDELIRDRPAREQQIFQQMVNHIRKRYRFDDPKFATFTGYKGIVFYGQDGNKSSNRRNLDMEEITVIGRMFDQFPMDPAEFSYSDIVEMRGVRNTANELYRDGKYDEAYPLLLDLAKRGFKDSQSRLAYILFNGTENIEKSNLRALGWLGTAAHGESEPSFRVLFKRFMAEVPESVRPTVDSVLAGYREQYDHSAFMDCTTNHRFNSGVVKRTYCQFDLEAQVEACGGYDCAARRVNVRDDEELP